MLRTIPVMRGFKFAVRISDLRPEEFVLMTCNSCGTSRRVAPWMLYAVAPPNLPIKSLELRMLCRSCGKRGNMTWSIFRVESPMHAVP
jgi:hypothetical protein